MAPLKKGFWIEKLWVPIIVAFIPAVVAIITSLITTYYQTAATAGNLQNGQKMCIVLGPDDSWRDSVVVPRQWSHALCSHFSLKQTGTIPGTRIQLACVFETEISIADAFQPTVSPTGSMIPRHNCGW